MSEKIRNKSAVFKAKGRWFRVYTEIVNDPKVQKLAPHLFKTWINLLALAAENDGKLPAIDDIAFKLRMSPKDADGHVCELIDLGLIDISPDRSLSPHNWYTRQYRWDGADPTAADRMRRMRKRRRERNCNGDVTVGVTVPASVLLSASVLEDTDQGLSIQGSEDGSCSEEGDGCAVRRDGGDA